MGNVFFTVDIGNTRTKFYVWDSASPDVPFDEFVDLSVSYEEASRWFGRLLGEQTGKVRWFISSVNSRKSEALKSLLANSRPNDVVKFATLDDLPMTFQYDRPEKLGLDRAIDAYAGAKVLGDGRPFLVVDVGTAATIDYVDSRGVFRGGAILPGARLMAESLERNTASLPMLDDPENEWFTKFSSKSSRDFLTYPATETRRGMRVGIVFALIGAIVAFYWKTRRTILEEDEDPDCLTLLLAGGDAAFTKFNLVNYFDDLESSLNLSAPRPEIIEAPFLTAIGLREIAIASGFIVLNNR